MVAKIFQNAKYTFMLALFLTNCESDSEILLSKVISTRIASWGLICPLWINSSKESVKAMPMLSYII